MRSKLQEEEIPEIIEAIKHYETTREIRDCLLIGFSQEGVWVGVEHPNCSRDDLTPRGIGREYLGIEKMVRPEPDGTYRLLSSYYYQPGVSYRHEIPFSHINGSLSIQRAEAGINAPNLKTIGRKFYTYNSQSLNLPLLTSIGDSADFQRTRKLLAPRLRLIHGSFNAESLTETKLLALEEIRGSLTNDTRSNLSYPELRYVGKDIKLELVRELNLENLNYVGGNFVANILEKLDAKNLEIIQGDFIPGFLGELKFPRLRKIGNDLKIVKATDGSLPQLKEVGGNIHAPMLQRVELPKLREVGGRLGLNYVDYNTWWAIIKKLSTKSLEMMVAQEHKPILGPTDLDIKKELDRRKINRILTRSLLELG